MIANCNVSLKMFYFSCVIPSVGLGLVLIPLPFPPPFGEILVVGGVSVLGTEFEAPKRAMRNARNALESFVGRHGDEALATEQLKQMESAGTDHDSGSNNGSNNDSDNNCDDDGDNDENDEKEKVILRKSFLTVISQQIDEDNGAKETIDVGGVDETLDGAYNINDCWTDTNIDANIDNMYNGEVHNSPSLSPSPTKQFLKSVGRNVVLPFLDHVVGDKKEGETPEKLDSKPANNEEDSAILEARNLDFDTNIVGGQTTNQNNTISNLCNDDDDASVSPEEVTEEQQVLKYIKSEESTDSEVRQDD